MILRISSTNKNLGYDKMKMTTQNEKVEGYFFLDQLSEVKNFQHNPMGPCYDIRKETYEPYFIPLIVY